jgi:hypothetical protein
MLPKEVFKEFLHQLFLHFIQKATTNPVEISLLRNVSLYIKNANILSLHSISKSQF